MPNIKTHIMYGEEIHKNINNEIDIDLDEIKIFSVGPDLLSVADSKTFDNQHLTNTKYFFECLIKKIKEDKLYNDRETMSFLYGQISHFILDKTIHPLVYYMTTSYPNKKICSSHMILEDQIEKYLSKIYNNNVLINKNKINSNKLRELIDYTYKKVYKCSDASIKYDIGMFTINFYNTLVNDGKNILPIISEHLNIGIYLPYNKENDELLNLEHKAWFNPVSGDRSTLSIEDLWISAYNKTIETIYAVNNYIYKNGSSNIPYLFDDVSYDTGILCEKGKKLRFFKHYN